MNSSKKLLVELIKSKKNLEYNQIETLLKNNLSTMDIDDIEEIFLRACQYDYLEVAKLIFHMKPTISFETAFMAVCELGNLELAKWLFKEKPDIDISAANDYAFRMACKDGHLTTAKWLESLCSERYSFGYVDGKMTSYKITNIETRPIHNFGYERLRQNKIVIN